MCASLHFKKGLLFFLKSSVFQNLSYFRERKNNTNFRDSYFECYYTELKHKLFEVQKPGEYLTTRVVYKEVYIC